MQPILFDYSRLMKRDTKIYSIGGQGIPGGISVNFTKVVIPTIIAFLFTGWLLGFPFKINMFSFMDAIKGIRPWNWQYLLFWLLAGLITGLGLWNIRVGGYRLYQYLNAYFRPKKVYTNNQNVRQRIFKLKNIKIKTIIRQEL